MYHQFLMTINDHQRKYSTLKPSQKSMPRNVTIDATSLMNFVIKEILPSYCPD